MMCNNNKIKIQGSGDGATITPRKDGKFTIHEILGTKRIPMNVQGLTVKKRYGIVPASESESEQGAVLGCGA